MSEPLCLIVDDEAAVRGYLSFLLQKKGIQSLQAASAGEALHALQMLGDRITLVITDIQMPGDMDGVDLAYSVKDRFSFIPVILISGNAERAPAGFVFVQKPFSPEIILNAVDKAMIKTAAVIAG